MFSGYTGFKAQRCITNRQTDREVTAWYLQIHQLRLKSTHISRLKARSRSIIIGLHYKRFAKIYKKAYIGQAFLFFS
jgi:hypothetical protein